MKKTNIIIVALIFLNLFTIIKLNSLENSINNYRQESQNGQNYLRNEINDIYSNIDSKLKKQASLFDSYDFVIGDELNTENLKVPVTVSVTPKEYSEGLTVSLLLNNEKQEMQKKGKSFIAASNAFIFDDLKIMIVLEQNGVEKIETIEDYSGLQYKFISESFGHFGGNTKYSSGTFIYDGEVYLNFVNSQNNSPEKISIVRYVDNKLIDEQQVDFPNNTERESSTSFLMKNEIELDDNEEFSVYVHVQDKYGLIYKYIILYAEIDSQGNLIKRRPEWTDGSLTEITDKDGNVLYNYFESH